MTLHNSNSNYMCNGMESRSQWPRGLRRRSSAARLLRLLVRIPPRAWMFVCCVCCVLSGRGLCDGLITRPEKSYRLWRVVVCDQETSKTRRLKPATGPWKIQPQWIVTPRKKTVWKRGFGERLFQRNLLVAHGLRIYIYRFCTPTQNTLALCACRSQRSRFIKGALIRFYGFVLSR